MGRPPLTEIADALFEIGMIEVFNLDMLELRAAKRGRGWRPIAPAVVYSAKRRARCIVDAHAVFRDMASHEGPVGA